MTDSFSDTTAAAIAAIADFSDPEQSFQVRLEKLNWGLDGIAEGMMQVAIATGAPAQLADSLHMNEAQQEFVRELITYFDGDAPDVPESVLEGLRSHPLLQHYHKLSTKSQKKLLAFAAKLDRKENGS